MDDPIVNRVAQSSLLTLDLEDFLDKGEIVIIDFKDFLFQGLILKEKEFRMKLKEQNWSLFKGKNVGLICSVDAIIPSWAYMLLVSGLQPEANVIKVGDREEVEKGLIDQAVSRISADSFIGKKVVIKGCGGVAVRDYAYSEITRVLIPVVSSLMYGEPCSTVPIYKQKTP